MAPQMWSRQHRRMMKRRIDDGAERLKFLLGARDVLVVAWFNDRIEPGYLHSQDGGTAPMPPHQVYHYLADTVDAQIREAQQHGAVIDEEGRIEVPPDEDKLKTVQ